jgi:hypothetical protein
MQRRATPPVELTVACFLLQGGPGSKSKYAGGVSCPKLALAVSSALSLDSIEKVLREY